jgi:hypothetical protein
MRLTKTLVDHIEAPTDRDQSFYRDAQLKGFAVRVTANGVKSFIVEKLIDGKVRRITIGRYGEITVEQARREAQKLFGKIATGIDPRAEQKNAELQPLSLNEVFQDYLKARKTLKPRTLYDYKNVINRAFTDWKDKPLLSITKDKVAKLHTSLGQKQGEAYANLAMRVLRALFNFAAVYPNLTLRNRLFRNYPGVIVIYVWNENVKVYASSLGERSTSSLESR